MTERATQLLDEVLKLSHAERAEIVSSLLTSLDEEEAGMDQAAVDAAWREEIGRRVEKVLGGEPGIPWEQVRAEAEARMGARRAR